MLSNIRNNAQSFGVKLIFGIIIVVFVFWGVGNMQSATPDALAVVNGEKISFREYSKALGHAVNAEREAGADLLNDEARFAEFKRAVLQQMVLSRLVLQEAKRLGLVITPHELKSVVDRYPIFQDASGKFDKERYRAVIAAQNMSEGEFEADLQNMLLEEKLLRYVGLSAGTSEGELESLFAFTMERRVAEYVLFSKDAYRDKVELGDDDINAYYEANKERFRLPVRVNAHYLRLTPELLAGNYPVTDAEAEAYYTANTERFKQPSAFLSRHIFFPAPPDGSTEPGAEQAVVAAKASVQEVLEKLQKGEDFSELAKQYSQDQGSAEQGGLLGWLTKGETGSSEYDEAAFALKHGEVGKPVRSMMGFHIIKLEEKKDEHTTPFAEARETIVADLGKAKADADFHTVQKAAEDGLAMGEALEALADKLHAEVTQSGLVPQESLESAIALHSDSRQIFQDAVAVAAGGGQAAMIPVPLNIVNGFCLVNIIEAKPSEIPPVADVRAGIVDTLQAEKSMDLARLAAQAALPEFKGRVAPAAYKDKVQTSKPVLRRFVTFEPLGPAEPLVDAIFASEGEDWLPSVYDTPQGPVIARVSAAQPITEKEWDDIGGIFVAQFNQRWAVNTRQAFMYTLGQEGTIEYFYDRLDSLGRPRR